MLNRPLLLLAALLALCPRPGSAATLVYDDDGVTVNGITDGTSAGWNTSSAVFFDGAADVAWTNSSSNVAQFGGGTSGTAGVLAVGAVTTGGLIFEPAASGSYTLAGGTITLGGTAPTLTANASAAIASALTGTAGFTKDGAGTLTLTGNNTALTGTINLNAGMLSVVDTTTSSGTLIKALGATSNALKLNGGTLQVLANGDGGTSTQTLTLGAYNTTVTADSTIIADRASGTTATSKTIQLGTLNIGASTLTITTANSYSVKFGVTTLAGNATFNVTSSGTQAAFTLNSIATTTNSITKTGAGAMVINAGNFGDLNVQAGNVDFNGTGTMGTVTVSGTSTWTSHSGDNWTMNAMVYNSTSTSNFNAISSNSTYTIGAGGLTMGSGTITVNASNAGVTTKVILQGDVTITGSASLASGGAGNRLLDLDGGTRAFTISSGAVFTVSPVVQNGGVTKEGAGTLKLGGPNTYAGGTVVNAGTLQLTGSGTLGATTADLAVNAGGTLDLGGTSQTAANLNGTGGSVTNNSSSAASLTVSGGSFAGTITNGTGALTLTKNDTGALALTSSAAGANTYSGGTVVNGGTLLGTDTTVYTGTGPSMNKLFGSGTITLADSTTLQVRADADGTSAAQNLNYGNNLVVTGNATIDVNRNVSTVAKTKTIIFGSLSLGASTLTVLGGNSYVFRVGTLTLSGDATLNVGAGVGLMLNNAIVGGSNAIIKEGTGTLTLQGGGTYGDLTINAGLVDVFATSNIQNVTVNGTGAFSSHSGDNWTMASLTYNSTSSSSITALSTSSTYTIGAGGLTMSKGTLQFVTNAAGVNDKLVLQGDVTITGTSAITRDANAGSTFVDFNGGNRSFNVSGGATFTITPVLQNGALTKTGGGVMAIAGANTYAGGTTLSQGTLLANSATGSATGSGAVVIIGGVLGGTGIVAPDAGSQVTVSSTGSINPGAASGDVSGILTINGDLVMDASAGGTPSLHMDIDGKSAGEFDRLTGLGTLTLDGTVNVVFASGYTGADLTLGTSFDLFDWTTVDATGFNLASDLLLPDISSLGFGWDTSHFLDAGSAGGVISVVTYVPEPSRALLLALSLGMLLLRRRRTV